MIAKARSVKRTTAAVYGHGPRRSAKRPAPPTRPAPDAQLSEDLKTVIGAYTIGVAQAAAQAGADAAVKYLAAADLLRQGKVVKLTTVIRDQSGFIVSAVVEEGEIIDEPAS